MVREVDGIVIHAELTTPAFAGMEELIDSRGFQICGTAPRYLFIAKAMVMGITPAATTSISLVSELAAP